MKILIVIPMLLACVCLQAQKVTYKYDAAGNRTERVINMSLKSVSQSQEATAIDDVVSQQDVKIYPNPTQGELAVEITGFSNETKGEITLLDANGRMLERKSAVSGRINFDLSKNPTGIYFLRIELNGESSTWKIIRN